MAISKAELLLRRKKFIDLMEPNSAAIFLSSEDHFRNADVEYKFRQDSSFWYLTEYNEPDSALLIIKTKEEAKTILFTRPLDKEREIWTGRRTGPEKARELIYCDEAFEFKNFLEKLEQNITGLRHLYVDLTHRCHKSILTSLIDIARQKRINSFTGTANLLGELRLFKSDYEISLMKEAAKITTEAYASIQQIIKAGTFEYEVEAMLQYNFMKNNAGWAYAPIVAAGENATILHYTANNSKLKAGDLLLIDAGCEFSYYACDVTRTYAVGQKVSESAKAVYDLVLESQLKAIEAASADNATIESVHEKVVEVLSQGLINFKLLKGSLAEVIENKTYRKFYMHRTSHWLGLDVHDVGSYQEPGDKSRLLKPGMVITVEPGLYFDPHDESIPASFRGIGVRIEDDVLIKDSGCEVLTKDIPKTLLN